MVQRSDYAARVERCIKKSEWVKSYKEQHTTCPDCGGTFPSVCFDFHHIDEKTKILSPAMMAKQDYSYKSLQEEIDKCVLICSNCHRLRHQDDVYLKGTI